MERPAILRVMQLIKKHIKEDENDVHYKETKTIITEWFEAELRRIQFGQIRTKV